MHLTLQMLLQFSSARLLADSRKPHPVTMEPSKSRCDQGGISWEYLTPHTGLPDRTFQGIRAFLNWRLWLVIVEVFKVRRGALLRKKSNSADLNGF